MRKVLSFLALVLVSLFTAVGLMLAAPSVAVGGAGHDRAMLALLGSSANVGLALSPGVCQPTRAGRPEWHRDDIPTTQTSAYTHL